MRAGVRFDLLPRGRMLATRGPERQRPFRAFFAFDIRLVFLAFGQGHKGILEATAVVFPF